jgi:hypothetical protein
MKNKSIVSVFDATKGEFTEEKMYYLPPKKALICEIMQRKGNYNTSNYPKNLDGIYKSKVIKDRLLYDFSENIILYSQGM